MLRHWPARFKAGLTQIRHTLPRANKVLHIPYGDVASVRELAEGGEVVTDSVLELLGTCRTGAGYLKPLRGTSITQSVAAGQHGEGLAPRACLAGDGELVRAEFAF